MFVLLHQLQVFSVLMLGVDFLKNHLLILVLLVVVFSNWLLPRYTIKVQSLFSIFIILGLILVSNTWQLVMDKNAIDNYGRQSHLWLVITSVSSIVWLLLGASLARNVCRLNFYIVILLNLVLLLIFYFSVENIFRGIVFRVGNNLGGITTFNHLFVSTSLLIVIFVSAYSLQYFPLTLNVFFPIWTLMIFLIQSRATLLIFVIVFSLYMFRMRGWRYSGIFFLQISVYSILVLTFLDTSMLSARFSFADGILSDASVQARIAGLWDINTLTLKQFLLGSVFDIVNLTGGFGGYAHNYFSMMQIYGIFLFVVIPSIIYLKWFGNERTLFSENTFIWLMLMFSVISLFISQSVVYKLPWFAIGLLIGLKYEKRLA